MRSCLIYNVNVPRQAWRIFHACLAFTATRVIPQEMKSSQIVTVQSDPRYWLRRTALRADRKKVKEARLRKIFEN